MYDLKCQAPFAYLMGEGACVGVFGLDTGQPLATSNGMGNYLRDHPTQGVLYLYRLVHTKVYAILYVPYGHGWENF